MTKTRFCRVAYTIDDIDQDVESLKTLFGMESKFVDFVPPSIRVAFAAVLARLGHAALGERGNYYPTPDSYTRRLTSHGFTVARMILFPRPTPLGAGGMAAWLNTFCRGALDALPEDLRETAVAETVALLAPALCDEEGNWTADYVRLRFIATI